MKMFISSGQEQDRLFRAIETVPTVQAKAEWCFRWFDRDGCSFATRLIAFAIVEGVFFCSSFAAIYWFRQRGILPGLCFSNELIARDETMHMRFACLLYSELQEKVTDSEIYEMLDEAVELEKAFFSGEWVSLASEWDAVDGLLDALCTPVIGLNASLMSDYIEYVADSLLANLCLAAYYNKQNPVGGRLCHRSLMIN